jgi:uncharacterized delta-60 repeat protein
MSPLVAGMDAAKSCTDAVRRNPKQNQGYPLKSPNSHFTFVDIAVVELTKNGRLNDRFGQGGKTLVDFGPNLVYTLFTNFVIKDETILVGAGLYNSDFTMSYFGVAELNKEGRLNADFGVGGETVIFGPTAIYNNAFLVNIALQSNGNIVLGGSVTKISTGQNFFAVAELTKNGRLNPNFGIGGETIGDFGANNSIPSFDFASSIVVQPDGSIVLAMTVTNLGTGQSDYGVAEVPKDGTLNPNFGIGGETIGDFGPGNSVQLSYAIVQPDGTIVLAGASTNSNTGEVEWAVAELSGKHTTCRRHPH